jgi:hypothetical protein
MSFDPIVKQIGQSPQRAPRPVDDIRSRRIRLFRGLQWGLNWLKGTFLLTNFEKDLHQSDIARPRTSRYRNGLSYTGSERIKKHRRARQNHRSDPTISPAT